MVRATAREENLYKYPENEPIPASLESVQERVINYKKKDPKTGQRTNEDASFKRWRWTFLITDGDFEGERAYGDTEAEYTTREDNKVRQWSEALLGRELDLGEELDTDAMLDGLSCYIVIAHGEPRQGTGQNADRTFYPCEVDQLYPMSK